jgi:hypothetical protein
MLVLVSVHVVTNLFLQIHYKHIVTIQISLLKSHQSYTKTRNYFCLLHSNDLNGNCISQLMYVLSRSMCVILDGGFGLDIGFIDHLYTRLGTTSNCSATADLRNSQITTAPANIFQTFASSPAVSG